MWLQRHFERSIFSLRIRVFLFTCWPEWVRVSLVSLWGSPLFFSRVHFIPLTIHNFFSLQCSYSLHSWALPKRGIFVDPHLGLIFMQPIFCQVLGLEATTCRLVVSHQGITMVDWRSNRVVTCVKEYLVEERIPLEGEGLFGCWRWDILGRT